jgi:tetratricopeptide (TPR) repeat protein
MGWLGFLKRHGQALGALTGIFGAVIAAYTAFVAPIREDAQRSAKASDADAQAAQDLLNKAVDEIGGELGTSRLTVDTSPDRSVELARRYILQALALAPNDERAHRLNGVVLMRQKDYTQAEHELTRAMELASGTNPKARVSLANLYGRQAQHRRQRAELDRALLEAPHLPEAYNALGWLDLTEGKAAAAAQRFGRVVELRPQDWLGYYGLGVALWKMQDCSQALTAFQRADQLTQKKLPVMRAFHLLYEGSMDASTGLNVQARCPSFSDEILTDEWGRPARGE